MTGAEAAVGAACVVVLVVLAWTLLSRRSLARRLGTLNFFFSSRRRHTSCLSDWSSDVCSSDLPCRWLRRQRHGPRLAGGMGPTGAAVGASCTRVLGGSLLVGAGWHGCGRATRLGPPRSEERRVGKEWWSPWGSSPDRCKGRHSA